MQGWGDAVEVVRRQPVDLGVVDPLLGGAPRTLEIERLHALFPSLPLVAYTQLGPDVAASLLALGRAGIRRALFERFDDAPAVLRDALRDALEASAAGQLLRALREPLGAMPGPLRLAIEGAIVNPQRPLTAVELAARAGMTRRTCERWFARAGLPSPRVLITLCRALYAHRLLLDPGYTVEDVAAKLGYGRARALQAQLREVFGATAGEMRMGLTFEEARARVLARLLPAASEAAS